MSSNVDKILNLLEHKPVGKGRWKALCPVHNEKTPSLHITEKGDKILMHCFGCGANGAEVISALGLELGHLFDKPLDSRTGRRADDLNLMKRLTAKIDRGIKLGHHEAKMLEAAIERQYG